MNYFVKDINGLYHNIINICAYEKSKTTDNGYIYTKKGVYEIGAETFAKLVSATNFMYIGGVIYND